MATSDKTKITIEATVKAPVDKVWAFWTGPDHIVKWNAASDDWHTTKSENDLRSGGKFSSRMEAKDGSFGFDFEAIYTEITDGKQFSYEFGGRNATVTFENQDDQTEVIVSFDPEKENSLEMQKNGWQAILDNFKKYTETN